MYNTLEYMFTYLLLRIVKNKITTWFKWVVITRWIEHITHKCWDCLQVSSFNNRGYYLHNSLLKGSNEIKLLERVLRKVVEKDKRSKKSGQSIWPVKSFYDKSKRTRRCSKVTRLSTDKSGAYEVCDTLRVEHWIEKKRKNFCYLFITWLIWRPQSQIERTKK